MSDYSDMRRRAAQQASTGNYWAGKCVGLLDENDRLRTQLRGIAQSDPDAELVAEVERLRAVITEVLGDLSDHQKDPVVPWCRICGAADGSWPCITRMVADDLNAALKGTTDDDDDGFIAHLRSGENEAEHHAADEIERLRVATVERAETLDRLAMAESLLRRAHYVGFHFGGGDAIWCIDKSWGEVHVDVTAHEAEYLWSLFGEGDGDE